jgi:oligopeptidase A
LQGLFTLVNRLYNLQVVEIKNPAVWHPDVRFFAITDAQQQCLGHFYLDLYARKQKRGGAWMDEYCSRYLTAEKLQTPVAYINCNITPASANKPALLSHDEVVTLFHEFGHGLHHLLTQVDYPSIAGINGVAWDAVELPSQFMEFFAWEKTVLDMIGKHYETGAHLPDELFHSLIATKHFHSGLYLLRQLEFALFDFRLHMEFTASSDAVYIQQLLDEIRAATSLLPPPKFNRFQHSFSHIFAGGYGAGYYSYLWAEVLACDAFAKFQEEGVFNPEVGQKFLHAILESGGKQDALELFIAFRGRAPGVEALLTQYEIN